MDDYLCNRIKTQHVQKGQASQKYSMWHVRKMMEFASSNCWFGSSMGRPAVSVCECVGIFSYCAYEVLQSYSNSQTYAYEDGLILKLFMYFVYHHLCVF